MKRKVALIMAAVLMVVSLGACSSTTSSSYGTESAESENNVRNSGCEFPYKSRVIPT